MNLKRSMSLVASGAFVSAGLVWLTRLLRRKPAEREEWDAPALDAKTDPLPKPALAFPDDLEEDLAAAEDAQRDIGEDALDLDSAGESEEVDPPDTYETVHVQEQLVAPEEPYDAVDADDLGTQWLFRATQASPPERPLTPEELAERAALEERNKP